MNQYFFQFLIPVASATTIAAIVVAFYSFISSKRISSRHEQLERLRFDYSKSAFDAIGGGLDALQKTVTTDLVPNVQAVYEHLVKSAIDVRSVGLVELAHAAGYQQVTPLSSNLLVFMGLQHDSLNISFLISFDEYLDLVINSFAYYILSPPPELLAGILELNGAIKTGTIGLKAAEEKYVVTINHATQLSTGRIEPATFNQILFRLGWTHSWMKSLLDKLGVERHQLLIADFLKLALPPPQTVIQSVSGVAIPALNRK
jgi:hypothetical protein